MARNKQAVLSKAEVRVMWGRFTNLIQNKQLKDYIEDEILSFIPEEFYAKPASSTGKYHPNINNGPGGLHRHSLISAIMANITMDLELKMFDLEGYLDYPHWYWKDIITASAGLHDIAKYGVKSEGKLVKDTHPLLALEMFPEVDKEDEELFGLWQMVEFIKNAIKTHHGKFKKCGKYDLQIPQDKVQEIVHYVDVVVSRKLYDQMGGVKSHEIKIEHQGNVAGTPVMLQNKISNATGFASRVISEMELPYYLSNQLSQSLDSREGKYKAFKFTAALADDLNNYGTESLFEMIDNTLYTIFNRKLLKVNVELLDESLSFVDRTNPKVLEICAIFSSDVTQEEFIEVLRSSIKPLIKNPSKIAEVVL